MVTRRLRFSNAPLFAALLAGMASPAQSAPCLPQAIAKEPRMDIAVITRSMLNDPATAQRAVEALGEVTERRHRGYFLAPADRAFREIWVASDAGPDAQPRYLRLETADDAPWRLVDLVAAFGPWKRVVPTPEGSAFDVVFRCDDPALRFLGLVFVSLSAEPTDPAVRIRTITIRREERL